jgi:hypothetical protein
MTAIANHPHRVSSVIAEVRADLSSVVDVPVWSMDPAETGHAIAEVGAVKAQLAELEARLLAHADRIAIAANTAASSTATWHAHATTTTRQQSPRLMRTAHGLDTHEATRTALAAGRVHVEQVEVVLRALGELPAGLDVEIVERAEAHLLELAADHDAKALRILGRRILEVVSPETADAHEATLLEREERAAAAATRFTMWEDGHGKVHGRFTLDSYTGAALRKALWAIAAPRHQASKGPLGDRAGRRPTPERLGQAFTDYIQRNPVNRLPKAGGLSATAVILIPLATLMGGLKAAHLDTGEPLSPGAARRLACQARIIPAVLGGKSQVLDQGRARRYYTEAQRIAKTIEARGCEIAGCQEPPGRCQLHHPTRWVDGGQTNRDGIMICPWHHTRAHDPRYTMHKLPTGTYSFHRRT